TRWPRDWSSDVCSSDLYGTGAIMSEPAHDERDHEFAKKYGLPIRQVIQPRTTVEPLNVEEEPFTTTDGVVVNSGPFTGLSCEEAIKRMTEYAQRQGFGKPTVTYRLKDWGVSRQRYWGTPIPMLYCEKDGIVIEHGNRRAPVALPRDPPVLQPIGDGWLPKPLPLGI